MSPESGRRADVSEVVEVRGGTTTLVLGTTSHDGTCRRLARAGPGRAFGVRATTSEPSGRTTASTGQQYETGVYDDLPLADAGVVVSETIENLDHEGATLEPGQLVVCLDGLPLPAAPPGRHRLFQFLHAVTRRVRDADGHCHAHLPVDAESPLAAVVAPLFEHVVDAADAGGRPGL